MKRIRNLLRYIIVIVLDVFMMITFHSYINFLILIGLIILPVYSIIGVRAVASNLTMDIATPLEPMEKKEVFKVRFILHNPTCFPILNATISTMIENRFYLEYGEHTLNVPIRVKQDTVVEYPIEMEYCGRFIVSVSKIHILDITGIYEVNIPVSIEKECLIFPNGMVNKQDAGIMYQRGVTEAMESREKGYDFSDISGIREYIPGDKLQNIHWKLSVKKDSLMVKERVSVSAQQLNVLVDLVNDEHMCLEQILELLDGVTKAFVEMNLPFTVYFYSTKNASLKDFYIGNEIERKTCMEMVLYDHSYKIVGLVEDVYQKQYPQGTYLYIGYGQGDGGENVINGQNNGIVQLRGF